jgi:hypothetical protein
MKRMKFLFGQRRMQVLLTLAVLLVAVSVVIGSGANFTSSSVNPSNTFSAGNLAMTNSKPGAAILTAALMKPGQTTASGTVTITNSGDIAGHISLSTSAMTDTPGVNLGKLSDVLTVKIMDGATQIYNGPIKSVGTIALPSSGTPTTLPWAVSEAHTYTFTVTFPDGLTPPSATTGDNAFKGSAMSIEFDWTGTSN